MTLWEELGYTGNPYDTHALRATQEGEQLLVGRDLELLHLRTSLESTTLHPTIEGDNGVGKTSLVFVTGFKLLRERLADNSRPIWLPMQEPLQIGSDVQEFERRALLAVAQTVVDYENFLAQCAIEPTGLGDLKRWLNDPIIRGGGGGAFGFSAEITQSINDGSGFADSGFETLVKRVLCDVFPTRGAGAIIAVIDNLELIGRSNDARNVLEAIRDTSLDLPGVRWVLCGARGIVRASVGSSRLNGHVSLPIELGAVPDDFIEELVEARLSHFAAATAPRVTVGDVEFRHLYEVLNHNLRDALKYAQDFTVWLKLQRLIERPRIDMLGLLETWLSEEAERINAAIRLQPRQWRLFDELGAAGGTCAPGDFQQFGFNSLQHMRTNFSELERVGLIVAEIDEDDHRRRTVNFTAKGWIVRYARTGFEDGAHLQAPSGSDA